MNIKNKFEMSHFTMIKYADNTDNLDEYFINN